MQINKLQLIFLIALLAFSFGLIANLAIAGPGDIIETGTKETGKAAGFPTTDQGAPKRDFVLVWGTYSTNFAAIMSALFLLLSIYAGWMWMSARGNEEKVTQAKKIMLGALIGLGIIIGGRLIVELALNYLGQTIVPSS